MTQARPEIPAGLVDEILFTSDHTCCICRTKGKDVQIHHIDGDRTNNAAANLGVLCLDCHSKVTGTRGLGRSYTRGEVRRYKKAWEVAVRDMRKVHQPRTGTQRELVSQVDLVVCQILAVEKNVDRVSELMDVLFQLHLWRGTYEIDRRIIEGLRHLALMSGLGPSSAGPLVAQMLYEMNFHFVDPKDVPMSRPDERNVLKSIEALEILGEFTFEFSRSHRTTDAVGEHLVDFFQIALWYAKRGMADRLIQAIEACSRACFSEAGELEFKYGRTQLRRVARRLMKELRAERPRWSQQARRLEDFLSR